MYPPDDLYEKIGFNSLDKMKEYGQLIGKPYTHTTDGPFNIHLAHDIIFNENLDSRYNRRQVLVDGFKASKPKKGFSEYNTRAIYLDIYKITEGVSDISAPLYFNAEGERVEAGYTSIGKQFIDVILRIDLEVRPKGGNSWHNTLISRVVAENGLIKFPDITGKLTETTPPPKLTGRIRLMCLNRLNTNTLKAVSGYLEVEDKIVPVKTEPKLNHKILYMIPRDIDTQQQQ